jgi:hypothetical protein
MWALANSINYAGWMELRPRYGRQAGYIFGERAFIWRERIKGMPKKSTSSAPLRSRFGKSFKTPDIVSETRP